MALQKDKEKTVLRSLGLGGYFGGESSRPVRILGQRPRADFNDDSASTNEVCARVAHVFGPSISTQVGPGLGRC